MYFPREGHRWEEAAVLKRVTTDVASGNSESASLEHSPLGEALLNWTSITCVARLKKFRQTVSLLLKIRIRKF
jgi:hypothetical protein